MNNRQRGMLEIIASGFCFGFLGIFGKLLFDRGITPGELLTLRFSLAAGMMFAYLLFRSPSRLALNLRQILSCALLGIAGYALFAFCFFTALTGLSASLTVLLLYTYPAFVSIGAFLLFKEKISRRHIGVMPVAALGLLALVWGELRIDKMEALFFGMGSSIFYSLYILVSSRLLRGINPLVSTPYIQFFAGLTLAALYLHSPSRAWDIVSTNFWLIGGVALICTVMAMSLFLAGLQKLKNWEVSLLSTTEPLMGVLLAAILLGERLTLLQLLGAACILGTLLWISRPAEASAPEQSEAEKSKEQSREALYP